MIHTGVTCQAIVVRFPEIILLGKGQKRDIHIHVFTNGEVRNNITILLLK